MKTPKLHRLLQRCFASSAGLAALAVSPASAQTASTTPPADDEVVTLSPFEVVSNNKGYYSANTM